MGLQFESLESLRLLSKEILLDQVASLGRFGHDGGYGHLVDSGKISVSSTATCVLSLVATSSWTLDKAGTRKLLSFLVSKKDSAGLEEDNPFTTAWILEAVTALETIYSEPLSRDDVAEISRKEEVLKAKIDDEGGVKMNPYPPSGYLTQLVIRVLRKRGKLSVELSQRACKWAWSELTKQLALIQAKSKSQDAFAVAYLLILATSLTPRSTITPEEASIQAEATKVFFKCQLEDGTWPMSRPLFHYPKYGNAHCYEFEMLTQLLLDSDLRDLLIDHLPDIQAAVDSLSKSVYRLAPGIRTWASGHHPQIGKPESWATASVYHFFHQLDRLLAEAVRRELFRYAELPLPNPGPAQSKEEDFAAGMLDSSIVLEGDPQPLKKIMWEKFLKPISEKADGIAHGMPFKGDTPRSAIFFGPPGTSKTEYSKEIARFLGWSYLPVDPSMLLRKGMEGIQAEANSIFRILEQSEGVVVLFDEFDELVLERGSARAELPFSRLLTTAMLPKLQNMHKRGRLVFIIATNSISQFDLAIRRPGRFDCVLQIMPPTVEAKFSKKDWGASGNLGIEAKLNELQVHLDKDIRQQLGDLTFSECNTFASALAKTTNAQDATSLLRAAWEKGTLRASVAQGEEKTWADRCQEEVSFNRIP
jgi:hypothetical protein